MANHTMKCNMCGHTEDISRPANETSVPLGCTANKNCAGIMEIVWSSVKVALTPNATPTKFNKTW